MKVKIGDKIYDPNDVPICIILTDQDKENISNMHPDKMKYISFPEGTDPEEIKAWVNEA